MIQLTVTYPGDLALEQLRIAPSAPDIEAAPDPQLVPPGSPGAVSGAASEAATATGAGAGAEAETVRIWSGVVIMVAVPESWHRELATVAVEGLASGAMMAQGQKQVVVEKGQTVMLSVQLSPPCESSCLAGASQCVNDLVRFCRKDAQGCASWAPPEACPEAEPFCSNGRCAAVCEDECAEAGLSRCVPEVGGGHGQGYQVCGQQHDSDSCLDWGPQISCGAEQFCSEGSGLCVPGCDGQPCPCSPGETQVCPDVGLCSGGLSSCVDGSYGPCQWQQGPSAERCDGQDNNCDTFPDNDMVAPACPEQRGVCAGALKECGGSSGWLDCGTAEYSARAASQGLSYEGEETLCDGKDNDCDGDIDEHEGCTCQPSCAGEACGADNGCGQPCLTGSCPGANESCVSGKCICQPSCAGEACGAEDGCGQPCQSGTCAQSGTTCVQGQCRCEEDESRCADGDTLEVCTAGSWTAVSCTSYCLDLGYDLSLGCVYSSGLWPGYLCNCGWSPSTPGSFGTRCTNQGDCNTGLFCHLGEQSVGFCTKNCPDIGDACAGAPAGTATSCQGSIGDGDICWFYCGEGFPGAICPGDLTCNTSPIWGGKCEA